MKELFVQPNIYRKKEIETPHGVAIIVLDRHNHILLAQKYDHDAEFGRQPEQWNVLMETAHPRERPDETVWRGIREELGKLPGDFCFIPDSYLRTTHAYYRHIGYAFPLDCFAVRFTGEDGNPNTIFCSHDDEIRAYSWTDPGQLPQYDLETGTRILLAQYQQRLFSTRTPAYFFQKETVLFSG